MVKYKKATFLSKMLTVLLLQGCSHFLKCFHSGPYNISRYPHQVSLLLKEKKPPFVNTLFVHYI